MKNKRKEDDLKICCPICEFEPGSHDRWMCSCMHVWNTFETMGRCPNCKKMWKETQCLACHRWSLHHKWYHYNLPESDEEEEKEDLYEYETA